MDMQSAFEREADEIDRQLANGEINNREHRQAMHDLELDLREAEDEEYMRHMDDWRSWP